MYKKIENNPFFDDIKSDKAKNNFNMLVDYLCSLQVPGRQEDILLNNDYKEEHNYFAKRFYNQKNYELAEEVLKNRTDYTNMECDNPFLGDGYSYIYELDREKLIKLSKIKYYRNIGTIEHELIHILMALNNNNPTKQHNEILSFFGERLTMITLSQKENNPLIYENYFINRCISRMMYRVYTSHFTDEYIENNEKLYEARRDAYPYMIGFIYATRLLDIYKDNKEEVIEIINDIMDGKIKLDNLLQKYHISLENEDTCKSFINMCDEFEEIVERRYSPEELHSVK